MMNAGEEVIPLPICQIRTFGGLEVVAGDQRFAGFGSRRARTLLAFVVSSPSAVHRDILTELLWPGEPQEVSKPRLRTELHRLRSALGDAGEILEIRQDTIGLDRRLAAIDTDQCEESLRLAGRTGDASYLLAAIEKIQGPFLPHETEAWCRSKRASWNDWSLSVFVDAAKAELSAGRPRESLSLARRGLSILADRPRLIRQVMEALVALGDVAEALATYESYVDRLEAESDLVPDEDLARYSASLRQERCQPVPAPSSWDRADLPLRNGTVFGRDELVSQLAKNLSPNSSEMAIYNLIGPGGVGKTTLALEVSRKLEESYRGRIYFVRLAAVSDALGLSSAVAESVGANVAEGLTGVAQQLKGVPSLIVLDNFEQLSPVGHRWLADLAMRRPEARILVTSRRSLGLSTERRIPVPPLAAPFATSLFIDRARRIVPDYSPGPCELADIEQVAERLEGLPLAVALAAARIDLFEPSHILRDLSAFSEVTSSNEDVEVRHRSLGHAIDWSLNLLSPQSRQFAERLTIFPRGWSMSAAERILGSEASEILPLLADHSLVVVDTRDGKRRFRLLQTIREHLVFRTNGEANGLRDRHADFFAQLVDEAFALQATDLQASIDVLKPEAENIEAALTHFKTSNPPKNRAMLAGLATYWAITMSEPRAVEWITEAAQSMEGEDGSLVMDLNRAAARMLLVAGQYDLAESRIAATERLNEKLVDPKVQVWTVRARAHLAYYRWDFESMAVQAQKAFEYAEATGDRLSTALALSDLAMAQTNLGKGEIALRNIENVLTIHSERGDESRLQASKENYVATLMSLRRWAEAERALLDLIEQFRSRDNEALEVQCRTHLATILLRTDRLDEAKIHLDYALDPARPADHSLLTGVRHYLGVILHARQSDRRATERAARNLFQAWSSVSNGPAILPAIDVLAYALASFGKLDSGKALLDAADAVREEKRILVSPHYALTYENVRELVGPSDRVEPLDSFESLFRKAQNAIWSL